MSQKCLYKPKYQSSPWSTAGTLYQVLMDEERTLKLKRAIASTVRSGDVVVDIGTGSGILACFAIICGARIVYAIESDPSNWKAAKMVVTDNSLMDDVRVIQGDAGRLKLPEKADVVMCELMSTALLDEPQIRLTNHAVKEFLKEGGMMIPQKAVTYGEFVTTDYFIYDIKLRVPQYEWSWIPSRSHRISETEKFLEVDFTMVNEESIRCSGSIEIVQDGYLNGLRLSTKTFLTNDITHDSSMGFCPRLVIPMEKEFPVKTGDTITYELSYMAGCGYSSMQIRACKR